MQLGRNFPELARSVCERPGEPARKRSDELARPRLGGLVTRCGGSPVTPYVVVLVALLATRAHAASLHLDSWRGHVSFGYGHLFSDSFSPAGSISVAGGVDYPVHEALSVGPVIGMAILGTHDVTRGSVTAGLDYSLLDFALQAHWLPKSGRISRVSIGPGFGLARTSLQVGGGGAGFLDLAVDEAKPELALDLSLLPRRQKIVAVGLEAGLRYLPVTRVPWVLSTVRLTIHY